ncbi:MAG: hypothetical protein FJY56_17875 [Betaproteobacteria bacterium]|nr:hypothetical protein [Betaproteobacteria bacterium]
MNIVRWAIGSACGVVCLAAGVAAAQSYPNRPIRYVVPFAAGGNADTLSRTASARVSESIGQQVVIDNRAGANGNIGMEIVARAATFHR